MDLVIKCFRNYWNFNGRARRKEYWGFVLFFFLLLLGFIILSSLVDVYVLGTIYVAGMFLPLLSVQVRRWHDIGKSGLWVFIALIPVVGDIIQIILLCRDSQSEENRYGPSPKEG